MPTTIRRALRPAVALLAVVALVGACGGDDSEDAEATTTTEVEETTTTEAEETTTTEASDDGSTDDGGSEGELPDPCSLFTAADLDAVTDVGFSEGEASSDTVCIWTGPAGEAFVVTLQGIEGLPVDAVLEGGASGCDDGTFREEDFDDAEGGFSCIQQSAGLDVALVGVVSPGGEVFIVLTGADPDPAFDADQGRDALVEILENAIAA